MANTIQRNTLVAPFSVNSPLLEKVVTDNGASKGAAKKVSESVGVVATTHQKWFTQVQQAINGTAQITGVIPANSSADGEPGTFAFDSNWLYVCVGKNTWRRAALNVF